jgi:hypothetical protein
MLALQCKHASISLNSLIALKSQRLFKVAKEVSSPLTCFLAELIEEQSQSQQAKAS